jgi:hypothetical protein
MEQYDLPVDDNCILNCYSSPLVFTRFKNNYSDTVNCSNKRIKKEIIIKYLHVFNFETGTNLVQSALILLSQIKF